MVPSETTSFLVVRFVPCGTLLEGEALAMVVLTANLVAHAAFHAQRQRAQSGA
jgi:hypothetical protein